MHRALCSARGHDSAHEQDTPGGWRSTGVATHCSTLQSECSSDLQHYAQHTCGTLRGTVLSAVLLTATQLRASVGACDHSSERKQQACAQDIWALAVMVYEALTATTVLPQGEPRAAEACARGDANYTFEGQVPAGLATISARHLLLRCLARDPAQRPTAATVRDEIDNMAHEDDPQAVAGAVDSGEAAATGVAQQAVRNVGSGAARPAATA